MPTPEEVWAEIVAAKMLDEPPPFVADVWKQCTPGTWLGPERERIYFTQVWNNYKQFHGRNEMREYLYLLKREYAPKENADVHP